MTASTPTVDGFLLSPQQRAVFLREGFGGLVTRTVRLPPGVDLEEIASRMAVLTADHEILRTNYVEVAGLRMPVQVVDPPGQVFQEGIEHGGRLLRAGSLSVRCTPLRDGTVLELELPRLSVDRVSWSLLLDMLLGHPPVPVPAGAPQYADVAAWLDAELERAELPADLHVDVGTVPFLSPVEAEDLNASAQTATITLDGVTLSRLRAVAQRLAVDEPAVLLAAWASLRSRYTRSVDQPISVVTDGRATPGLGRVLGLLERPVPVRLSIEAAGTFAVVARTAKEALAKAAEQENLRDPAVRPETSFRYQWDPWCHVTELSPFQPAELPGRLHLDCTAGADRVVLTVTGPRGVATDSDLVSFARALESLLADVLADPDQTVGRVRLVEPVEQPPRRLAQQESVLLQFLRQADRAPDHPAIRSGEEVLSYRELACWAESVAATLNDHGIRHGDQVPVLVPAAVGTPAAMVGCWLAGAAFVPLDPAWPKARIETIIRQLDPRLVLVPNAAEEFSCSVDVVPLPPRTLSPATPRPWHASDTDAAYVVFTSGTSGVPKGVVIGHAQLAHYTAAIRSELDLPDRASFAAMSTLAADLSYTAIFPTLAGGGCVRLVDAANAADPRVLAAEFREHPVQALKMVPSHLSALLAEVNDAPGWLPTDVLVLGGEALPPGLTERLFALAPQLRVYNHYGPTETTIGASCRLVRLPVDPRCASVPVGATLGGSALTIVDESGNPLPPWCPGEIVISGPGVGIGYLDEVRAGHGGFCERGSRQYRTGDLGRVVPGVGVEVIGRLDDQVKLRGYRIQLREIELLLLRQRSVEAAAVMARHDDSGLVTHLDAYVVRGDRYSAVQAGDLKKALGRHLLPALVPTAWQFLDALPLTRNGKVDRDALLPIDVRGTQPVRPSDSVVQRLLVIWSEVLGIEDVSPDDDFFDLGGHSLHAIKLVSRVNGAFGTELPMASVLSARTAAAMAGLLRGRRTRDSNLVPLRPARKQDGAPVFCFHPGGGSTMCYWELARLLPAGNPVFGVEAWGLHGGTAPTTFVEMARQYAAAIVEAGHPAPVLVGWCFGGLVARETAEALRRSGEPVTALILLDCPAPGFADSADDALQEAQLLTGSRLASRFAWHFEPEPTAEPAAEPTTYELLMKAMQTGGHLPAGTAQDEVRTVFDAYTANMTAWEEHLAAGEPEYPEPDHPVLLVRAEPAGASPDQDRTWGWSSRIGPGLAFTSLEADHHSLMRPPMVAELAAVIASMLKTGTGSR